MDSLVIEQTRITPGIELLPERSVFRIYGRSLPENAHSIYKPVIDWVNRYFEKQTPGMTLQIDLEYFNSSSGKYLMDLLNLLNSYHKEGLPVKVTWFYAKDDHEMLNTLTYITGNISLPLELTGK